MKLELNEALPPMIPEYPVEIAGHHLTLRFDVNINKTKKGVKLQFIMQDVPQDPRKAQQMANEIGKKAYLKNLVTNKFVPKLGVSDDDLKNLQSYLKSFGKELEGGEGVDLRLISTKGGKKSRFYKE